VLSVNLLPLLHNLGNLVRRLGVLKLRGGAAVLDVRVGDVLALARLSGGGRELLLLLVMGRRLLRVLRGLLLQLLCLLRLLCLLLLISVVILLLGVILRLKLGSTDVWARRRLGVESLILVRTLRLRQRGLVALVLLLLLLLMLLCWLLCRETLVLFGAIAVYPALSAIAPFGVDPSEWGPIVRLLLRIWRELLRVLLVCNVLWRRLRRVVVCLLQEGIQVVLVLLV
jgi:hypothetical protein